MVEMAVQAIYATSAGSVLGSRHSYYVDFDEKMPSLDQTMYVLYACATGKKCRVTAYVENSGSAITIMRLANSVDGYALNAI
jgi:hypothetical protein